MFDGFSPETMDFLWGIRLNNNREWFLEHKTDYQKNLYAPMKELAEEVFAAFQDVPAMDYKLSRIYKDARLHPAVPYKESLWLSMRPESSHWSEQPTLYFEISPEGGSYGAVWYRPTKVMTERYRERLANNPAEFPALVKRLEKASGLQFNGENYYRKQPCPEAALEPYYNLKSLQFLQMVEPGDLLFSGKLAKTVIHTLRSLYPFYEYCLQFSL